MKLRTPQEAAVPKAPAAPLSAKKITTSKALKAVVTSSSVLLHICKYLGQPSVSRSLSRSCSYVPAVSKAGGGAGLVLAAAAGKQPPRLGSCRPGLRLGQREDLRPPGAGRRGKGARVGWAAGGGVSCGWVGKAVNNRELELGARKRQEITFPEQSKIAFGTGQVTKCSSSPCFFNAFNVLMAPWCKKYSQNFESATRRRCSQILFSLTLATSSLAAKNSNR